MKIHSLVMAALVAVVATSAVAQEVTPAKNLDELLRLVEEHRTHDKGDYAAREAEFRQAKGKQQQMLKDVRARIRKAERRSESLEKRYDENELKVADVQDQLNRRMGTLRELFGVLQQVAGETNGVLAGSVTSAQYPNRGEFLTEFSQKLGSDSALPSMAEIERLWYLMQQEMTENGKVARFNTTVITADGHEVDQEVVRIGGFNLVSANGYLQYSGETGKVSELSRQPQGRFASTARELATAHGGQVTFGVDPTRGQILETYLDRPNMMERVGQGGIVGYVIIALGIIGLLLALERLISLSIAEQKVNRQVGKDVADASNPLGRVFLVAEANNKADIETLELKLDEAMLKETPSLTRGILFLKIISVVAPLLGLLGTVTGMIVTFQAITLFGTGDPKLMAGGISQALVTTVLGLTVAIPVVLLHSLVNGRSQSILHVLQEQSVRLLAEHSSPGSD